MPAKRVPRKKPASEAEQLRAKAARLLGISEDEAELRALRVLLATLPERPPEKSDPGPPRIGTSPLPQRLYLLLDGRGLDGRGMPVEVIDLPCVIGSGRQCSVWVNSPQIETRHLQISQDAGGWILEDLGTEHGTYFADRKIQRRAIQHGDEYRLANYLRLRTELR
ncbi:MAG TPA: FHA domain-containing protein [Myxococcales bacterium]|nr:FHA domain-containing protein [Myxococcales bacterium]